MDVRPLGAELRAAGVPTRQLNLDLDGERVNRNGVRADDVQKALAGRAPNREIEP